MATSRIFSLLTPAAALVACLACADVARADASSAGRSSHASAEHVQNLPPIVPLASLLGMSVAAGLLGLALSRRRA